jgi:hypothetical protein
MADIFEEAPSGRSKCRACQQKIDKGALRYGERVPNPFGDGEATLYYHLRCGAERRPEPFHAALESWEGEIPDREALLAEAKLGVDHRRLERLGKVERASSGRARCRQCKEPIDKGALRLAVQPIEDGMLSNWGFIHPKCAFEYVGLRELSPRLRRYSADLADTDFDELEKLLKAE